MDTNVSPSSGWALAIAALVLGAGVGTWQAQRDFGAERFVPFNPVSTITSSDSVDHIVVLNGDTFEFGMLQRGSKMSHDFVLQNVSDHPIDIWVGESSCTCTVASLGDAKVEAEAKADNEEKQGDLEDEGKEPADELPTDLGGDTDARVTLEPEESKSVTLQWEGLTSNPQFTQNATILTSDPEQESIVLTVKGYVRDVVRVEPDAIQMNNVSVEKGATAATTIYCAEAEFPTIRSVEFVAEANKDLFEVSVELIDDLEEGPNYRSARRLVVRAKPGLPVGTVSQKLRLDLEMDGHSTIFVAVTAKVESELTILGNRDYRAGVVRWGVVDREKGRETTLFVIVKGQDKQQVKLEPVVIDPENCLEVEVLPVKNPQAATWTIPVVVRLKPDAPTTSRLGGAESEYGIVRLHTGHPVAKELQFKVQFAVN